MLFVSLSWLNKSKTEISLNSQVNKSIWQLSVHSEACISWFFFLWQKSCLILTDFPVPEKYQYVIMYACLVSFICYCLTVDCYEQVQLHYLLLFVQKYGSQFILAENREFFFCWMPKMVNYFSLHTEMTWNALTFDLLHLT